MAERWLFGSLSCLRASRHRPGRRAELHRHNVHVGERCLTPIGGDYVIGVAYRN